MLKDCMTYIVIFKTTVSFLFIFVETSTYCSTNQCHIPQHLQLYLVETFVPYKNMYSSTRTHLQTTKDTTCDTIYSVDCLLVTPM